MIGNSLALYTLTLGKDGLGKKRSKTIFLHIMMADLLVTMFPMAGINIWEVVVRFIQKYDLQVN